MKQLSSVAISFSLALLALVTAFNSQAVTVSGVGIASPVASPAITIVPDKIYKLGIIQLIPHQVLDTFRQAAIDELAQSGFVQGQNLTIDFQNAQGDVNTAATIAAKLVSDDVDAIFCITTPACQAAAKASGTVPLVFGYVTDPIAAGLVTRLDHPGGNVTGVLAAELPDKQLEMIRQFIPEAKVVGVIWNQGEPNSRSIVDQMKRYASQIDMTVVDANVSTPAEVQTAAQSLVGRVDVVFVPGDNTAQSGLPAVVRVCETNKIPLFTSDHESVKQGAIAAYNYFEQDAGSQAGNMLARVLSGQNPGEINVEMPAEYKLSINNGAAQRMGVTVPETILQSAAIVIP